MDNVEKTLSAIQVYDVPFTKIRIGNGNDGGYIALKEICDKTQSVYSFGIGNDVAFELDWTKRYPKSKIFMYDPYIDCLPVELPQFNFRKLNVASVDHKSMKFMKNSLMKIDIEGNEWIAFQNLMNMNVLQNFNQILVEFHFFHTAPPNNLSPYFYEVYSEYASTVNEQLFETYSRILNLLCEKFLVYHVHANNSLPIVNVGGHWFPPLLEVSFVNQSFVSGHIKKYNGTFPVGGLDVPNKLDRPDILDYYPLNGQRRKV